MFFYLADIALIEIYLDVTGQAFLPDFLDVFTEAQIFVRLATLFFLTRGNW